MTIIYFRIVDGPLDGGSFGVDMGVGPPPEELYWKQSDSEDRIAVHIRSSLNNRFVYKFDGWNTTKELGHEHHQSD